MSPPADQEGIPPYGWGTILHTKTPSLQEQAFLRFWWCFAEGAPRLKEKQPWDRNMHLESNMHAKSSKSWKATKESIPHFWKPLSMVGVTSTKSGHTLRCKGVGLSWSAGRTGNRSKTTAKYKIVGKSLTKFQDDNLWTRERTSLLTSEILQKTVSLNFLQWCPWMGTGSRRISSSGHLQLSATILSHQTPHEKHQTTSIKHQTPPPKFHRSEWRTFSFQDTHPFPRSGITSSWISSHLCVFSELSLAIIPRICGRWPSPSCTIKRSSWLWKYPNCAAPHKLGLLYPQRRPDEQIQSQLPSEEGSLDPWQECASPRGSSFWKTGNKIWRLHTLLLVDPSVKDRWLHIQGGPIHPVSVPHPEPGT